ncbi:MAG: hypothetical protein IT500_16685 [Rubrivivax sp.]|nr:hypothetical protein [Rubrivivax sp.]
MKRLTHADFNDAERELDRIEPAWADFVFGLRDGLRIMRDTDAVEKVRTRALLDVHEEMEGYRRRFDEGHAEALIGALRLALEENVPVPYWASVQIRQRLGQVMSMTSAAPLSLHDAFGLEKTIPSTAKRYSKARADLQREWRLWVEVNRAKRSGLSFDAALELVLKTKVQGIGKTAARELYLRRDAIQLVLLKRRGRKQKAR